MHALMRALNIFIKAERPLSAADLRVRFPWPVTNPRRLTIELRRQGCISEVFRVRSERFFALVPDAVAPVVPERGMQTTAAIAVRKKQRLAMLAREARRREWLRQ